MKYIIAIIHTIISIVFPLFMMPFLNWYKITFCQPDANLFFVILITIFISIGTFIMTIIRWVVALRNDKSITI